MALQTKTFSTGDYSYKSWSNSYKITLTLTEESVDLASNTSLVSYLFTISNTDNNRFISYDYSWKIYIGGQEIVISHFDFLLGSNFTTQTIAAGQVRVTHTGTPMAFSVSVPNVQAWTSYGPPAMTLSGTLDLTLIPRASAVSCPGGAIGTIVEVAIAKADPGFTHTLTYAYGELTGTIKEKTALDVVKWVIPMEFYNQIPESKQEKCTITCTSYAGDVAMGTSTCKCYVGVHPELDKPVLFPCITDCNPFTVALTGNAEILVRYHSEAMITADMVVSPGAELVECYMTHNGNTYDLPAIVSNVETGVFKFYAKDSRGLKTSFEVTPQFVSYINLTSSLSDNKPDGEGNMVVHASGNCFTGAFGMEENTLAVEYRYKVSGGTYGPWEPMPVTLGVRTYHAEVKLTGLDYKTAYTFQTRAKDRLAEVYSREYTVRATPVFDWDENDFNINGALRINDTTVVDFPVKSVEKDDWFYRSWDSGICEMWGVYSPSNHIAGDNVWRVKLPIELIDAQYAVNISASGGASGISKLGVCDGSGNDGRETGAVMVFANLAGTNPVGLHIHILGRWK